MVGTETFLNVSYLILSSCMSYHIAELQAYLFQIFSRRSNNQNPTANCKEHLKKLKKFLMHLYCLCVIGCLLNLFLSFQLPSLHYFNDNLSAW